MYEVEPPLYGGATLYMYVRDQTIVMVSAYHIRGNVQKATALELKLLDTYNTL